MATTRLITHHISKGDTIAKSLADRFEYGQNPDRTQNGELVAAYMCDPETADAEFLLSKSKYRAVTGREQKKDADVLCYQIRQSFVPGEIDAETAMKIGYDFAMRWTKGKHAFFVATHIDHKHIHNHIYYNSITLDCTHKFRDFLGSARAVRQLSDRICFENSLSYIDHPKLHSKGKYKHYGEWRGDNRPPAFQERLKTQIDICLADKPLDMEAIIEGRSPLSPSRIGTTRKVNLIIDIQSRMKAGKGPAYEQWAKVFNLKQMAATLQYLKENGLSCGTVHFSAGSVRVKAPENECA